jgi:hypothetical protein
MASEATESNFLEALYKDLALALGDAVWAFARIEWLTYESLGHLSSDHLDEIVGDLNFRSRTAIIRRIVEQRETSSEKKNRALSAIQSAEDLAGKRNIIVHNPWRIWIDIEAKEFMTKIQKYTQPNRTVDLKEIRSFVEACGKAEVELREALYAL